MSGKPGRPPPFFFFLLFVGLDSLLQLRRGEALKLLMVSYADLERDFPVLFEDVFFFFFSDGNPI
jgi:hypothetical protein